MWQTIVILVVVLAAAAFVVWRLVRVLTGRARCNCPSAYSCPFASRCDQAAEPDKGRPPACREARTDQDAPS